MKQCSVADTKTVRSLEFQVVLFLSLIFCKQEEKLLFFGSVSGCTCLILNMMVRKIMPVAIIRHHPQHGPYIIVFNEYFNKFAMVANRLTPSFQGQPKYNEHNNDLKRRIELQFGSPRFLCLPLAVAMGLQQVEKNVGRQRNLGPEIFFFFFFWYTAIHPLDDHQLLRMRGNKK